MDYSKHYNLLIEKHGFRTKPSSGYYERHHIIPRCKGGSDCDNNQRYLTFKAHLLAHWLLVKINPNDYELAHAFGQMCMMTSHPKMKRRRPPFHILEFARIHKNKMQSKKLKGNEVEFNTKEAKEKRAKRAHENGSFRGLKNGKSNPVDVYNYFTGELVASKVSVTEWGRENNVKRNLNATLYADRTKRSSSNNRHHSKGFYIVNHGSDPYPPVGGEYKGPYTNQGHIGLKKGKKE